MTYEEYKSATPSISSMRKDSDSAYRGFIATLRAIRAKLSRITKNVSCLWRRPLVSEASPVREPSTAKPQGFRTVYPPQAPATQQPAPETLLEKYRANRMADNLDDEIAQLETLVEAKEIIINRRKA